MYNRIFTFTATGAPLVLGIGFLFSAVGFVQYCIAYRKNNDSGAEAALQRGLIGNALMFVGNILVLTGHICSLVVGLHG